MDRLFDILAFPTNLLLAALWVAICCMTWKRFRFLASPAAVISSILLFMGSCIWIGVSGNVAFTGSVFFIIVMLYLMTVLLCVLLRGWKTASGKLRYHFILHHAGLLIALGSAFWGSPDNRQMRMMLHEGETSSAAVHMNGKQSTLKDEISLISIECERYENGTPMQYTATISIDEQTHSIQVNHPLSRGIGEDIYLVGTGDDYCILEIVNEPWKYFALVGIIMMIAGAVILFIKGPRS